MLKDLAASLLWLTMIGEKKVDLNKAEDALKNNPDAKILAFVHAETSTGALSDPESLTKLAHEMTAYRSLTL